MRMTLLEMVQNVLSGMDSDEVNSISDTVESLQVVDIIQQSYNHIVSHLDFPVNHDLFELVPSGDASKPTLMTIPSNVLDVDWVQYDNALDTETVRNMVEVRPMDKLEFFRRMHGLDTGDTFVYQFDHTVGAQTFDVRGRNDAFPAYYTNINNNVLLFDNYNSNEDTTLVQDKTFCYGLLEPTFTRDDSFVPELDTVHFSLLLNEAKQQASAELKQVDNAIAGRRARKDWVASRNNRSRTPAESPAISRTTNFGRRRR